MIPLISFHTSTPTLPLLFLTQTTSSSLRRRNRPLHLPKRPHLFPISSSISPNPNQFFRQNPPGGPPRTQFPGGFKRPELKLPNIVLHLHPDDVFSSPDDVMALIDEAVSKWVGIIVLDGRDANGGRLYDAACKLKSVVRDRAYLLVSERVDIAAAADASGILLSDQGLPTIVARATMMASKSDSVVLPLVARNVLDVEAAVSASSSEGADFLIYGSGEDNVGVDAMKALFESVKIPVFVMISSYSRLFTEAPVLLKSGASGIVTCLKDFRMLDDDALSKLFDIVYMEGGSDTNDEVESFATLGVSDVQNGRRDTVAGFIRLEDREKKFIETERSVLLKAIDVMQRAAPLMEEVSLLVDAVSQMDEPFSLVIVVIVC